MTLQRKPLDDISLEDLEELVGTAENDMLEFKSELPAKAENGKPRAQDRWLTHGDGIGSYARDQILAELVAFANAEGGTLVLGVQESNDRPRLAEGLSPLPKVRDLVRRLLQACDGIIQPRIPIVAGRAVPTKEGGDDGYVILRVARSGARPHRLETTGLFYLRRGEDTVKMAVREIRELVLETERFEARVSEMLQQRAELARQTFEQLQAQRTDQREHAMVMRVSAVPLTKVEVPTLPEQPELWWRGDSFTARLGQNDLHVAFPADRANGPPEIRLRALICDAAPVHRRLQADGLVEAAFTNLRPPGNGRVFEARPLHAGYILGLIVPVLCQIQRLRTKVVGEIEFGLEVQVISNLPLCPAWEENAFVARSAECPKDPFPRHSVREPETFDALINSVLRDIWHAHGLRFGPDALSIDWNTVLAQEER